MGIAAEAFAWRLATRGVVKRTNEGENLLQADRGIGHALSCHSLCIMECMEAFSLARLLYASLTDASIRWWGRGALLEEGAENPPTGGKNWVMTAKTVRPIPIVCSRFPLKFNGIRANTKKHPV